MHGIRLTSLVLILLMFGYSTYAQHTATDLCAAGKHDLLQQLKTTIADPLEDQYDVQHLHLDISLINLSTAISGNVVTTAKVVVPAMTTYAVELLDSLTVDSVKINGQVSAFVHDTNVIRVTLPAPLAQNTVFTAQVFYHGTPPSGNGFANFGINNVTSPTYGVQITYTLSEPYSAHEWWPAKQSLQDKIDSADIWITVPAGLKAGSNGLLQNITPMPGNQERYEWKTRYPMDYYLVSAAVGDYIDYSYYVHFPNSNDSTLVQNYVYDHPQVFPAQQARIDTAGLMIPFFSDLFGRYPFWQEKYGHCMAPLQGGMEHQTMTTLGNFGATLVAHELGHQWFGDYVTCATWKDIWLNEGFASYTEYLFVHQFRGAAAALNYMDDVHDRIIQSSNLGGTLYVDDTTTESRIFDGRLTYNKGSSVVHMLRYLTDDDNLFYSMLRGYLQQYGNSTATTEQFKVYAEAALNQDLDTFVSQWIYKEGFPMYTATYNQLADTVFVQLMQSTSVPASVSVFKMPVELRLTSPQGDTIVKVYNDQNTQLYKFKWNKNINGLRIDPNDWLLDFNVPGVRDNDLGLNDVYSNKVIVYPNPSVTEWQVLGLPANAQLRLTDMSGRVVWQAGNGQFPYISIPAAHLSRGMYFLYMNSDKASDTVVKLIKQ